MSNAIIIYYTGRPVDVDSVSAIQQILTSHCGAMPELMTIKAFDENSIAEALLKKGAEDMKTSAENPDVTNPDGVYLIFDPKTCKSRLHTVKCIRRYLTCTLGEANNMYDSGRIDIPKFWGDPQIYDFVKDLYGNGCTVTGGIEAAAVMQAAVFLNTKYETKSNVALVSDFAAAQYNARIGRAEKEQQALLTAVELVKNNPTSSNKWVYSRLIDTINSL